MSVAAIDEHLWWYVSRSTGIIAFAVITASVSFGLMLSTRLLGKAVAPAWLMDIHKYLGTLGLVATAAHLVTLVFDGYTDFSLRDLFVPGASQWKTTAVAWGVVAMWLLVVIEVTSWYMRKLPRHVWHAVHMSSFVLFAASLVHGLEAGTDAKYRIFGTAAIVSTMTVLFLGLVRYLAPRRAARAAARARVQAT